MSRSVRWLLALLALGALLVWALDGLLDGSGFRGSWGAIAVTVWLWWQSFGTAARRRESDLTARALAAHRDPGPHDRAAVDARARALLAAPRADEWLPAVLLAGLAVACVVTAVVRRDPSVALPAVPLVAVAVLVTVWTQRRLRTAARWLDDPPYEREHA